MTILIVTILSATMPSQPPAPELIPSGPLGSTDYPWTMFHHDTLRTGATQASAPTIASLMWTFTTGAQVYASPAVSDGTVFVPSWDGKLYAIDEYSGALRWTFNTGMPIFASPAVSNGIVYVASRNGLMYALNEQNGGMIWRTGNPNFPITSSPVVSGGKVFYGTWCAAALCGQAGQFMALDAATGAILWTNATTPNASVASSPSIHNGLVFFGQDDGSIVALNEADGVQVWRATPSANVLVRTAPAVGYGLVFVGTDTRFVALNELTGVTAWTLNDANNNATSGALDNGIVYLGTGRGNVFALNATTGAQMWSYSTGSGVSSSPAVAQSSRILLVGSNDHYLYGLNMTTGNLLWRYQTGAAVSSSPAIADGRVFFGSQDFNVYGLGPRVPRLQVSISPSLASLKPGEVSVLTITVTDGSSPQSGASLTLTSSSGGGFSVPAEQTPGMYLSNYTAPLVNSVVATTIVASASKAGYLGGSGSTSITLNPFPPLKVYVTPKPPSISPGGDVVLLILVMNGSQPVTGASIFLSSTGGGSFSAPADSGGGNYTAIFSSGLQSSTSILVVQASKPGFSPGTAQVTVTVSGVPDLTTSRVFGLPLILVIGALALLFLAAFIGLARRNRQPDISSPYRSPDGPSYVLGPLGFREGLSRRFQAGLLLGLAAIAGS